MTLADLTIREAQDADLPAVLALFGQPDLDNGNILSLDEAKKIFAEFARYPHYKLYVAERGGRIIATYALLIMHNLGHLGAPSAIAEDVVVDATSQGQGVGRAMMRHALAEARAARCYKLALSSNAKRIRAHEFYERLGFERHGYSFLVRLDGESAA